MTDIRIELSEPYFEVDPQLQDYFSRAAAVAAHLPGGYVKKIVWDKAGGYPKHAWGYIQFSPRPFRQGYGCDGTTDDNVHLIAATLCQRLGLNYGQIYRRAYLDSPRRPWVTRLLKDEALHDETLIPSATGTDELLLMLSDLYQINNRSLVDVLQTQLTALSHPVDHWWKEEDRLRGWIKGIHRQMKS